MCTYCGLALEEHVWTKNAHGACPYDPCEPPLTDEEAACYKANVDELLQEVLGADKR